MMWSTKRSRYPRGTDSVAVVGIGGGSALDVAKVVALLLTNVGTVSDRLGPIAPPRAVAPLVLARRHRTDRRPRGSR